MVQLIWMLRWDAGGGRETTFLFGNRRHVAGNALAGAAGSNPHRLNLFFF